MFRSSPRSRVCGWDESSIFPGICEKCDFRRRSLGRLWRSNVWKQFQKFRPLDRFFLLWLESERGLETTMSRLPYRRVRGEVKPRKRGVLGSIARTKFGTNKG